MKPSEEDGLYASGVATLARICRAGVYGPSETQPQPDHLDYWPLNSHSLVSYFFMPVVSERIKSDRLLRDPYKQALIESAQVAKARVLDIQVPVL